MTCWESLPPEILFEIFQYYIEENSQRHFLYYVSNVCTSWRNAAFNTQLWKTFDGTLDFRNMLQLCKRGVLINTEKFYFCQYSKSLPSEITKKVLSEIPNIRYINLNGINKFPIDFFEMLAKYCQKLNEIDFSGINLMKDLGVVQTKLMVPFLSACGSNLLSINLSSRKFSGMQGIINHILEFCPNLQEFICLKSINRHDVSLTPCVNISVFQKQCPKLNTLRITPEFSLKTNNKTSDSTDGFSYLEVLTCQNDGYYSFDDTIISSVLCNSAKLKVLDVRGNNVTASCLASLPATDLEYLYLSNSKVLEFKTLDEIAMRNMLRKWCHSLKVLDLSKFRHDYVNDMVLMLLSHPDSKLEVLNVRETRINCDTVYKILKSCPKLHQLNLESCRVLERGMKRVYNGRKELLSLLNTLSKKEI